MTFTTTFLPQLAVALLAIGLPRIDALELNAVDPDTVVIGASPSTTICPSAHLQSPGGSTCAPNALCAAQYFLTDVEELETEVSLMTRSTALDMQMTTDQRRVPPKGAHFTGTRSCARHQCH